MKVSAKRQITLSVELCEKANIDRGDIVDTFVDRDGIISIVKKTQGAALGVLASLKSKNNLTETASLDSAITE